MRSTSANNDENKMTSRINFILHVMEVNVNEVIVRYNEKMKIFMKIESRKKSGQKIGE